MKCPRCEWKLPGLGTYCERCEAYVDDMLGSTTDTTPEARPVPDDRSEAEIQLAIRRTLEAVGFHVYDLSQDRPTRQTAGLGDLYVVGHGRCAWIECKSAKGRQSDAQRVFGRLVTEAGGIYLVWRSESEAIAWAHSAPRESRSDEGGIMEKLRGTG